MLHPIQNRARNFLALFLFLPHAVAISSRRSLRWLQFGFWFGFLAFALACFRRFILAQRVF